jgi:hypothetical protein
MNLEVVSPTAVRAETLSRYPTRSGHRVRLDRRRSVERRRGRPAETGYLHAWSPL